MCGRQHRAAAGAARVLIVISALGAVPTAAAAAGGVVPDPALAACVNAMLERPGDTEILVPDLADLREVRCPASTPGVSSLEGLQHASKLRILALNGESSLGGSEALRPIAALNTLRELNLQHAQLSSLSPLSELTGITQLFLGNNALASLDGVENLTQLTVLGANRNQLVHVDALRELTSLSIVTLSGNQLQDISGLQDAAAMTQLWVDENPTLNGGLDAFAGKPALVNVNINRTGARDLAVFAEYPAIGTFQAIGNHIGSLVGLPAGTSKITLQQVAGRTLYVGAGATSHRIDVTGEVTLRDGVTLPEKIGMPAGGGVAPDPDPAVPFIRVKFGADADRVSWGYDAEPALSFNGTVTDAIERVRLTEAIPDFTVDEAGAGSLGLDNAGFVPDPAGGWALGQDAPAFLQIDPVTGVITGKPATPGSFTFTVSVRDALGNEVERRVTLTVRPAEVDPPVQPPVQPPVDPPVDPPVEPPVDPPVDPPAPPVHPQVNPPKPPIVTTLATTGGKSAAALWWLGGALGLGGIVSSVLARRTIRVAKRR